MIKRFKNSKRGFKMKSPLLYAADESLISGAMIANQPWAIEDTTEEVVEEKEEEKEEESNNGLTPEEKKEKRLAKNQKKIDKAKIGKKRNKLIDKRKKIKNS